MFNKNIEYKSKELLKFYCCNRQRWEEFYPSEKWVFGKVAGKERTLKDVLDVGCACGGLGTALNERFILNSYTGVDINKDSIDWARKEWRLPIPVTFIVGDIVDLGMSANYDVVVSLSCADWNIETSKIIDACWKRVRPGGYFIISLRLTPKKGVNDIEKSYQYINFSGDDKEPEIANYVIFNFRESLMMMKELNPLPESIGAYGYWGSPSSTAVTPFDRLVFAVFYIKKGLEENSNQAIKAEFNLPMDILL